MKRYIVSYALNGILVIALIVAVVFGIQRDAQVKELKAKNEKLSQGVKEAENKLSAISDKLKYIENKVKVDDRSQVERSEEKFYDIIKLKEYVPSYVAQDSGTKVEVNGFVSVMSAADLAGAFLKDKEDADLAFGNRIIKVNGMVSDVRDGQIFIDSSFALRGVRLRASQELIDKCKKQLDGRGNISVIGRLVPAKGSTLFNDLDMIDYRIEGVK